MLNLLYTSSKTVLTTGNVEILYVANADAFYIANPLAGSNIYRKLYRDGTVLQIGTNSPFVNPFHYDNIANKDGVVVTLEGESGSYIIDPISWVSDYTRSLAENMNQTFLGKGLFLDNQNGVTKYYRPSGGGYIRYDESTGASEATVVVTSSYTIDTIHFRKNQEIVLFDNSAGRVFFYDVASETVILETSIEPAKTAAYDTIYQNIVSIRLSDNKVQVYDSKPKPYKLSSLTISPNALDRYTREDVSVMVLGSDDEPIEGIDLQWEVKRLQDLDNAINANGINIVEILAGASFLSAKGKITPNFTTTDANGIASAVYCPPGLDWALNDTEVIIPTVKR